MGITYKKLIELLENNKIPKMSLKHGAKLSNEVISKIDKDEYMSIKSLERIAEYISRETSKKIQIGDIVEFK